MDRLAQAQAKVVLTAFIDPYSYPASAHASEPLGYDVEIVKHIAQLAGLKPMVYWADTGTRGSLGRALRDSIVKGRCDFFMGLSDTAEDLGTMGDETGPGEESVLFIRFPPMRAFIPQQVSCRSECCASILR